MSTPMGYMFPFNYETIDLTEDGGKRTFWKQLLPLGGEINYKGEKIVFDRNMLTEISKAYADKAYDMVPFQLANDDNSHPSEEPQHMDPRKTHGELTRLKFDNRGLWGKFALNDDAVKVLENTGNKLGVSVSVKRGYQRADGKFYPFALRHVLGTLDGKVTGLAPWSTVELSNTDENEKVEDLSGEKVVTEVGNGNTGGSPNEPPADTVTVPRQEWDDIKAYVKAMKEADDDLAKIVGGEGKDGDKETVDASNSGPSKEVIDLSNEIASEKFERFADDLVRKGVPPSMIDAARPVLSRSNLMDLSNDGSDTDPRVAIRKILGEAQGTVDLSNVVYQKPDSEKATLDKEFEDVVMPFFTD